jgi:metal-sulfur cluster biosynthetic enzyme
MIQPNKSIPGKDDIYNILSTIKDPETQQSIFELGLVKSVDYVDKEKRLIVKVDFLRRNPSCVGCLPIAWMVQKKITDDLFKQFNKYKDIEVVEFVNV